MGEWGSEGGEDVEGAALLGPLVQFHDPGFRMDIQMAGWRGGSRRAVKECSEAGYRAFVTRDMLTNLNARTQQRLNLPSLSLTLPLYSSAERSVEALRTIDCAGTDMTTCSNFGGHAPAGSGSQDVGTCACVP